MLEGALSGIGDIGGDVNNEGGTISPGGSPNNSAVPEPQTLGLVILGLLLLVAARWKLFVLSAPSVG